MDPGELPIFMAVTDDYKGWMLFAFENGKAAKVELITYETKTRRRKLMGAYYAKSPLVYISCLPEDGEYLFATSASRMLIVNTAMVPAKTTRDTMGVQVMTLKKGVRMISGKPWQEGMIENSHRLRTKNLPAAGALVRDTDSGEQLTL